MNSVAINPPLKNINASIQLGGSKSISNRLLILKEVFKHGLKIHQLSDSEDTRLLQDVLDKLKGKKKFDFNVHHAGTDFRFLTAFLAAQPGGTYVLSGSERLKERPIAELVNALRTLGAEIQYLEKVNHPPLRIVGQSLKGGCVQMKANISSQFISALLLISPLLSSELEISLEETPVSTPYIHMSVELLKLFGVKCQLQANNIKVLSNQLPFNFPDSLTVESDWSSASYWMSVCALSKNAKIKLSYFEKKSLQADACLPELYAPLGVKAELNKGQLILTQVPVNCKIFKYNFSDCPDIAPTIACTCLGLGIKSTLSGLKTLQLKESRRMDVLQSELQKFGAIVKTSHDTLEITPPENKTGQIIRVSTFHDHRIAMAFAPLALVYPNLIIEQADVVNKSYPRFWKDLQSLGFSLNLQS